MKWEQNKKKIISTLAVTFFIVTGTYNAVVINSESHINSDVKFVKRLDEVYGVTKAGREVAATTSWQKLAPAKKEVIAHKKVDTSISSKLVAVTTHNIQSSTPVEELIPQAAVQEELELNLVEVSNPKKWQNGLGTDKFSGNLMTNNGVIEALNVSLPNGEGVSVSFSEMTGNVFQYDMDGEIYSGMMYQVDQGAYMVTLTNGPLEGTRLRFNAQVSEEQTQETKEYLAENHNVEVGNFGETPVEQQPEMAQNQNSEITSAQGQGFNF